MDLWSSVRSWNVIFLFWNRAYCEISQVFIYSEDVKHLKGYYDENSRKNAFFIKFPILENIFKLTLRCLLMAGTDPELKAESPLGEKTWNRESFRLRVPQFCCHVHCCWNAACPPSSQKSLYIHHSVRIQPEMWRCLIPSETILLLDCISCFNNVQRESSLQANRSSWCCPLSYMLQNSGRKGFKGK